MDVRSRQAQRRKGCTHVTQRGWLLLFVIGILTLGEGGDGGVLEEMGMRCIVINHHM